LTHYGFTKGEVIDKISLPRKRVDVWYAQWQYVVDKDTFLFVDKRPFIRLRNIGAKATIIYRKEDHQQAMVYNFQFWIRLPLILLASIIAFFIFAVSQFVIHWNDKEWFDKWYRRR